MILEFFFTKGFFIFLFTVLIGYVIIWYVREYLERKNGKYPPGPYGVPLLGFLPFAGMKIHEKMIEEGKKYGPIMYITLGKKKMVVLNEHDIIKEALALPALSGRADSLIADALQAWEGCCSIFFRNGDAGWKMSRKTAVRALSHFSTSNNSALESVTLEACEKMVTKLEGMNGAAVNTRDILVRNIGALMSAVLFGLEVEPDGPLMQHVSETTELMQTPMGGLLVFSEFMFIPTFFVKGIFRKFSDVNTREAMLVRKIIDDHKYEEEEIRTVIDALKKSIQETNEDQLSSLGLTKTHLEMLSYDMFGAGSIDVPENMIWIFLILAKYPHVQEKVFKEIEDVIGYDRLPSILDQENMLYLQATILEELRYVTSAPIFPRMAMEETQFRGYTIPKGADVMGNWWAVNHDPSIYDEPMEFKPERYLIEDGRALNTALAGKLMTFSTGTRRCIGENLSKQIFFVFTARLLQKFQILLDPETKGNPLEQTMAIGLIPGPHKLIFKPRDQ